ncbi:UDP-glycosyltransferase 91D2-like protein [Drosera capensis]
MLTILLPGEPNTANALGLELSNLPFLWALRKPMANEDSIGGFICHCDWNSSLEALHFGKPLITLPFFGDQGITARFYEDKQLGIGIPRDEQDGSITRNTVA